MTALITLLALLTAPEAGEQAVVFRADFDAPNALEEWTGQPGELAVGHEGTPSLMIENHDGARSSMQQVDVPVDRIAGRLIALRAVVKAENVSEPPNSWNGIKVMLILDTPDGKQYPQLELPVGTFDWLPALRALRVPRDTTKATLCLGLEKATGAAWFDTIEIRVGRIADGGRRSEAPFKGHDLPRLRGVMHGPRFVEKDLRDLAVTWGANQVRWQLNWTPMKKAEDAAQDLDAYDAWLDGALSECDKALDACEKFGLMALVDLHTPPGGRAGLGVCRMFAEQHYQDKLVEVWDRIARRYKGRPAVYAYDLLNEPVEGRVAEGLLNWRDLATKVTKTIRAVDPGKPVVFEPGPWGSPDGFDTTTPLDLDRVIYSFHMYRPHAFTHQGVHGASTGLVYPGIMGRLRWDKERLREAMMPAIDFQRTFNVHLYVGEFSAIRWAPDNSAHRYLRDVIDLLEEYGWDWSYHAFREWDGWSVEHGPDPDDHAPSTTPTDRQKLLCDWFAKNEKPTQQ